MSDKLDSAEAVSLGASVPPARSEAVIGILIDMRIWAKLYWVDDLVGLSTVGTNLIVDSGGLGLFGTELRFVGLLPVE